MDYFYSGGGNNRPSFTYRFLVSKITEDMWNWCDSYPLHGPFERWHVIFDEAHTNTSDKANIPLIQFESRKAAYMFRLAFSEYIIEDRTYDFAKGDTWLGR